MSSPADYVTLSSPASAAREGDPLLQAFMHFQHLMMDSLPLRFAPAGNDNGGGGGDGR
jgi:hypothetical protein